MNISKKKTKLICFSISILLTTLIVLSCAISMPNFGGDDVAQAAEVGAGTASVLNLDNKGVAQDYFSKVITGGQNEYVYFGENVSSSVKNTPGYGNTGNKAHTGAIKWRVLSVNDTKYNSDGDTWLLWADYQLGCGYYNPNKASPYYAFWGNSMIRAKLNGGKYQSTVTNNTAKPSLNQTVSPNDSWYFKIFKTTEEKASLVQATSYITWDSVVVPNGNDACTQTIVGTGNNYNATLIADASARGAHVSIVNNEDIQNAVQEIDSGDYLFFIDYDDINNTLYGFGDNGVVYAKLIDPNWESSLLTGYYLDEDRTVVANYLKESDIGSYYYMRPAIMWTNKQSAALGVHCDVGQLSSPYVDDYNGDTGIRPAFNFSPKNVIYATAANVSSNGATFNSVNAVLGSKPAYKVYLKSNSYTNYSVGSHADMPKLTTGGSTVSISKTGQSGSAVFLLADPSGNGEVKYQATATFNGSGVATANLPGGIKASDYVVTVLFLDGNARGGEFAEVVTASYTGLTVPEDKATTNVKYYTGSDLEFNLSYADADCLDVSTPTYLGLNNATTLPSNVSTRFVDGVWTLTAREVGKYTVKIKPKSGKYWVDGTTTEKTYEFYIKRKVSEPKFNDNSTSISSTYNSAEQSFAILNYNSSLMDVKASAVADLDFDGSGSPPVFKVTKAKTYVVGVDLLDTTLMEWSTVGDSATKYLTITIDKKQVAKPRVSGDTSKPYTGEVLSFPLSGYVEGGDVRIIAPTSPVGASVDGGNLKATDANTYVFTVSLADSYNTEWADGSGTEDDTLSIIISTGSMKKPSLASGSFVDTVNGTYAVGGATFSVYNNTSAVSIEPSIGETAVSVSGNTITVTKVGTYSLTVKLKNTTNTTWEGGGVDLYTFSITVARMDIALPSFMNGADKKTYNGSNQTFALSWNKDLIDVMDESGAVVTASISEKNAKEYTYTMHLKDVDNTQWAGTNADTNPKDLKFTMDKKALAFTITCSVSGTQPSWETGKNDVVFTVVENSIANDTVKLMVYIEKDGNKSYDFASIDEATSKTLKATVPDYLIPGGYVFGIELPQGQNDNDNYKLPTATSEYRKNFIVKGQGLSLTSDNMPWRCKYFDTLNNFEIPVDIMGEGYVTGKAKVTYNTFEYEFYVDVDVLLALGAQIDESKGDNGFSGDVKCTNATSVSKTVTVYWKPAEGFEGNGGSYTLTYDIEKAKYDLTNVTWNYTNPKEYNPLQNQSVYLENLPNGLTIISLADYSNNRKKDAGKYTAKVENIQNSNVNYITPSLNDKDTYIYKDGEEFPWSLDWEITPKKLTLNWVARNSDNNDFVYYVVSGEEAERVDSYLYYRSADYDNATGIATGNDIKLSDIVVPNKDVHAYWAVAVLTDSKNYEIVNGKAQRFTVGSYKEIVKVEFKDSKPFVYNGNQYGKEIKVSSDDNTLTSANIVKKYYKDSVSDANELLDAPKDAGKYILVVSLQSGLEDDYEIIIKEIPFEIEKAKIIATWDKSGAIPKISGDSKYKDIIGYIYYDEEGNELPDGAELEVGKSYKVKAILKESYGDNYELVAEDGETLLDATDQEDFTVTQKPNNGDGNNVGIGSGDGSGNQGGNQGENQGGTGGSGALDEILEKIKKIPLWQLIASVISIILTIIFLSKTASYDKKRRKYNKKADKLESMYGATWLSVSFSIWTAIACVLMALAVVSFVMMIIAKNACEKAEENYEDRLEEYNRNKADLDARKRDESMRTMFMGIQGVPQGGYAYAQPVIGAEDIRGIISDTVTALLPGMQQMLPQQASSNDELVEKLIEQNEKLMQQLAEQQPTEKVIEREVAVTSVDDEAIQKLMERNEKNDERIEALMQKILELSSNNNNNGVQVVEKVVEKEVPIEKVVEKVVEVPVEKIVEKVVEKEVKVHVPAPSKPKKEAQPRLTLDEAYALLSKQQQKYFDGLKEYALSKPNTKEKKATYSLTIGQSAVNPLLKLTIKKNTTVALFKMEDEYLKDIKRDASGDGTKIKVKETEVIIGDAQACKAAKNMIDLREDQIERYQDLLKEQRAMRK